MFSRFQTKYRWDPREHEAIFEGFENVLKDRYRDRLRNARKMAERSAREAGHDIVDVNDSFNILVDHRPEDIPVNVWERLCAYWNTPKWKKISENAKQNRSSRDSNGLTSRHTGGSIGNAEHRRKLQMMYGREPTWMDVYMHTHLTAESKERYKLGDHSNLRFCSQTAADNYATYQRLVVEKYGEDPTLHKDDADLWAQADLQRRGGKKKGPIYGIGSADLHYVVTGTHSTGSASSSQYAAHSQEVEELRELVTTMIGKMEAMEQSQRQSQSQMQSQIQKQVQEENSGHHESIPSAR